MAWRCDIGSGWGVATVAVAVLVLTTLSVDAQVMRGDSIPQTLHDVPAASGMCRVGDDAAVPAATARPAPATPAPACTSVDSSAALRLAERGAVVIDVRSSADFQAFHIQGTLNADLFELRGKPYWSAALVVLVGDGKAEGELLERCARLQQCGYRQLHVLRGGIPAWLGNSRPVQGSAPAIGRQLRLTVADYLLEVSDRDNTALLDRTHAALQSEVPHAITVPGNTPAAIKALLARRVTWGKRNGAVVLASAATVSDEQIAALQQALLPVPVLVYAGGREAVVRQSIVDRAMWLAHSRGPRQPGCGS